VVRSADLDGGAADNSGLATLLDLWRALEPTVSAHNASVLAGTPGGPDVVVVPLLVLVDNDYETSVVPGPVQRQRELSAPIELLGAQGVLSDQGVLEQRALLAFSGGSAGPTDAGSVRFFRVGPTRRPGVAAPLGWTLSDITRRDLDAQLGAANGGSCPAESGLVAPLPLPCFRAALVGGP